MIKKTFIAGLIIIIIGAVAVNYFVKQEKERAAAELRARQAEQRERNITIIEGWKIKDIADDFDQKDIVSEADFLAAAKIGNWRNEYDFLADPEIKSLEGFIFPDTYRVFKDATAEDIIRKALDNFEAKVTDKMKQQVKASGHSLNEAIIMASIVEREALYDEDRFMIADIFWKRIKAGIGLQSDATVNYATGKKNPRPRGRRGADDG
jgi:UPF0755 protein